MSSLADLPELVGFFSYSREDDEDSHGALSALRDAIQRELGSQLGRSKRDFRLWQDKEAIAPGKLWESELKTAVEQAVFFVPIVTPRAVKSKHCMFEFESFLKREAELGRDDLVFPILYINVWELEDEKLWREHPVLKIVGTRQYLDWRNFRHHDLSSHTDVLIKIDHFCRNLSETLQKTWMHPRDILVQKADEEWKQLAPKGAGRERKDELVELSPELDEGRCREKVESKRERPTGVSTVPKEVLADLPELAGFFSYSRDDDEDSRGALSALRDAIQRELSAQLGRSHPDFRVWQDKSAIAHEGSWEEEMKAAIEESVFFIPIVTPRAMTSHHCRFALKLFLSREAELGRSDLIFPILYIRVPALDTGQWERDETLKIIVARQYTDWQNFRYHNLNEPIATKIESYAGQIVRALRMRARGWRE